MSKNNLVQLSFTFHLKEVQDFRCGFVLSEEFKSDIEEH